jgi:hypothetical protein
MVNKMRSISQLAENVLAFSEGLCSKKLVGWLVIWLVIKLAIHSYMCQHISRCGLHSPLLLLLLGRETANKFFIGDSE